MFKIALFIIFFIGVIGTSGTHSEIAPQIILIVPPNPRARAGPLYGLGPVPIISLIVILTGGEAPALERMKAIDLQKKLEKNKRALGRDGGGWSEKCSKLGLHNKE